MKTLCFKHRKADCGCIPPPTEDLAYKPATHVVGRKSALEVYYACGAFKDTVTYSPEGVKVLAQAYLTVADILADFLLGPNPTPEETVARLVEGKKMLKEAGFEFQRSASVPGD